MHGLGERRSDSGQALVRTEREIHLEERRRERMSRVTRRRERERG